MKIQFKRQPILREYRYMGVYTHSTSEQFGFTLTLSISGSDRHFHVMIANLLELEDPTEEEIKKEIVREFVIQDIFNQ